MKQFMFIIIVYLFMGFGITFANLSEGIIESVEDLAKLEPGHWYIVKDSGKTFLNKNWADSFPCNSPYHKNIKKITDYSGGTVNQRDRTLLLHGGGHAATSFNGIIGFDLDTLSWKCVEEGSVGAVHDEWETRKVITPEHSRIAVDINGNLNLFEITKGYSTRHNFLTGSKEPDWTTASNFGDTIREEGAKWGEWTNRGIISWQPNYSYVKDERILGDVGVYTNLAYFAWGDGQTRLEFFKCVSESGRSGRVEPKWSSAADFGEVLKDGDLIWKNMGPSYYNKKFENGSYPWSDKKGSVHTYGNILFSEKLNAVVFPISYGWYPYGSNFINDHPWLYILNADKWNEYNNDSSLNTLGIVNSGSTMAIDQKRNIVWMYRSGGKAGPRLCLWTLMQ